MEHFLKLLNGTVETRLAVARFPKDDVASLIAREKLLQVLLKHNEKYAPVAIPPQEPPQVEGEPGLPRRIVLLQRQAALLQELMTITKELTEDK